MSQTIICTGNGAAQIRNPYESVEFNLVNAASDYDLDTEQATFKAVITDPQYCKIYTSKVVSIKFDATTNHAITLAAGSNTEFDRQSFTNIFLSNGSGETSAMKIYIK